jgi:hypothetical protein
MLRDAHRRRSVGLGALDIYYKQYMSSHLERSVSREELGVQLVWAGACLGDFVTMELLELGTGSV